MKIDSARCTGCGRCVAACPLRLFSLEPSGYRKHAVFADAGLRCDRCLKCLPGCPVRALGEPASDSDLFCQEVTSHEFPDC